MGTLTCRCGHVIPTNHDNLAAYRGDLLPQVHTEQWAAAESAQLQALAEAIQAGQSFSDFVGGSPSPEVVNALLTWKISGEAFADYSRSVFQCPVCARLFVETSQSNHFRTFLPESDDTLGILDA